MNNRENLHQIIRHLKGVFVGKDEIIDLLAIALIARENAFLYGPPGTAKSAIVRGLSSCIKEGKNFEYLLTRFTEPNEIFGPFDIRKLKEGELATNVEGMMPEASMVFLDEIFNANSAILNSLLMALNEKVFRRGKETFQLPALMFVGASNVIPEDETLHALLDRFLIRIKCDYVEPEQLESVLLAGRKIESGHSGEVPTITPQEIISLQQECQQIDLSPVRTKYVELVHSLRNAGVKVSDRRAVKCQNLLAASALLAGRVEVLHSDLWVLKYIWDSEEQIEVINGIINHVLEQADKTEAHPQAYGHTQPNAENLMKDIQVLKDKWTSQRCSLEEQNLIKDKLRYLQNQSKWVTEDIQKQHLQKEIDALWQIMLQTV